MTALAFDSAGLLYIGGIFGTVDGKTRRGLARLNAAGALDAWDPDLLGVIPVAPGSGLRDFAVHAIVADEGRVLAGGEYCWITAREGGGGYITCSSSLVVFAADTGALLRPTDPSTTSWFSNYWGDHVYGIATADAGIAMAIGRGGVVILDRGSLDVNAAATAPLRSNDYWAWGQDGSTGVFALALPLAPPVDPGVDLAMVATPMAAAAAPLDPHRLVVGGVIPNWGYHVAGNVLSVDPWAAPPVPPVAKAPVATLRTGAGLAGSGIPARLTWSGTDADGPGIASWELARSVNSSAFVTVATGLAAASHIVTMPSSGTVRYAVRAVDGDGVAGAWAKGPTLTARVLQQTRSSIRWSSGWRTASRAAYSGGSARWSKRAGASSTWTVTGRTLGLVVTTGLGRGKVKVYVNGAYVTTVDTRSSTVRHRVIVWSRTWGTSATRKVRLVVVGTAGRPRVDIDGMVTLR